MTVRGTPRTLVCAIAVALLSGCGDGTPANPPGSHENPLVAKTSEGTKPQAREPGAPATSNVETAPGYKELVRRQSSQPNTRFTPCSLVTRAQAGAIMRESILPPREAPQGPTCVYRAQKGKHLVTLAVQTIEFRRVKGQLRQPTRFNVASRTGICGQFGQPVLYVRLARARTLTVAGPCAVARQFASRAVRRLTH